MYICIYKYDGSMVELVVVMDIYVCFAAVSLSATCVRYNNNKTEAASLILKWEKNRK